MFDISIKILSLSDAEIYFIRPSVAHVTSLYTVWISVCDLRDATEVVRIFSKV